MELDASCWHRSFQVDNQEIRDMKRDVDVEVILLGRSVELDGNAKLVICRLLIHARGESVKSKEAAAERERRRKRSWWSFGWYKQL